MCYVNGKSDGCRVLSYDATSTKCYCLLSTNNSLTSTNNMRRRLATSNEYQGQVTSTVGNQTVTPQAVVLGKHLLFLSLFFNMIISLSDSPTYSPTIKPTMGYTPVTVRVTQKIDGLNYNDFNTTEKVILLTISIRSH